MSAPSSRRLDGADRTEKHSPRSIELHQNILLTLGHQLIEILGDGNLYVVSRVVRDGLCINNMRSD